jgi:hypothetical protein
VGEKRAGSEQGVSREVYTQKNGGDQFTAFSEKSSVTFQCKRAAALNASNIRTEATDGMPPPIQPSQHL